MERLFNYLNKIGVEEKPKNGHHEPAPAEYYRETYGDATFFDNAPNHTHPGAVVALDYNTEAPAEYFQNLNHIEKKITAYCKKYGYTCRRNTCHYSRTVYFYIEKLEDREAADSFYYFRDAARKEAEQAAHILYTQGRPDEVNATIKRIIDKYGESYTEFLQATAREEHTA